MPGCSGRSSTSGRLDGAAPDFYDALGPSGDGQGLRSRAEVTDREWSEGAIGGPGGSRRAAGQGVARQSAAPQAAAGPAGTAADGWAVAVPRRRAAPRIGRRRRARAARRANPLNRAVALT